MSNSDKYGEPRETVSLLPFDTSTSFRFSRSSKFAPPRFDWFESTQHAINKRKEQTINRTTTDRWTHATRNTRKYPTTVHKVCSTRLTRHKYIFLRSLSPLDPGEDTTPQHVCRTETSSVCAPAPTTNYLLFVKLLYVWFYVFPLEKDRRLLSRVSSIDLQPIALFLHTLGGKKETDTVDPHTPSKSM